MCIETPLDRNFSIIIGSVARSQTKHYLHKGGALFTPSGERKFNTYIHVHDTQKICKQSKKD